MVASAINVADFVRVPALPPLVEGYGAEGAVVVGELEGVFEVRSGRGPMRRVRDAASCGEDTIRVVDVSCEGSGEGVGGTSRAGAGGDGGDGGDGGGVWAIPEAEVK